MARHFFEQINRYLRYLQIKYKIWLHRASSEFSHVNKNTCLYVNITWAFQNINVYWEASGIPPLDFLIMKQKHWFKQLKGLHRSWNLLLISSIWHTGFVKQMSRVIYMCCVLFLMTTISKRCIKEFLQKNVWWENIWLL